MFSHVVRRSIRPGVLALGFAALGAGCAHAPAAQTDEPTSRSDADEESAIRRDNAALRRRVQMLEDRMLRLERHANGEAVASAPRRARPSSSAAEGDLPVYQLEPETAGAGPDRPAVGRHSQAKTPPGPSYGRVQSEPATPPSEPNADLHAEATSDARWDDPSGFARAPEAGPEPSGAGSYRLVGTELVRMTEPDKPKRADRTAPGKKGRSQKAQYDAALATLRAGDHAAAVAAFSDFVAAHPKSDLADNAVYWMGEASYDQGHYADALASFTAVIERYAGGNKASDALLKIGLCYAKLGDNENARDVLHRLIDAYPGANASDVARIKLAELS